MDRLRKDEEINPDEMYEIHILDYINAEAERLDADERPPSEETYIALGHKITAEILEREGANRRQDGTFDIRGSTILETGEFDLVPQLLQQVPSLAIEAQTKAEQDDRLEAFSGNTVAELLAFSAAFEKLIEPEISKEMEVTNG